MRRAQRLLDLIQILRRHRHPVIADNLAAEMEVSVRTVYRDISALVGQGVPVRGEAGIGYVLEAGFDLPPLMFNADEVEAVLVGMRWLRERADPGLARAAEDVMAKVTAVVPANLRPLMIDGTLFAPVFGAPLPVDKVDIGAVRLAIRQGRKVAISYSDEAERATERIIWPIGLSFFERARVIIAWCELRADFRYFRTDRIERLHVAEQRYPERRAVLFTRWQREELPRMKALAQSGCNERGYDGRPETAGGGRLPQRLGGGR
jgi:predicted DNA-binding transcriptional regulator YafY